MTQVSTTYIPVFPSAAWVGRLLVHSSYTDYGQLRITLDTSELRWLHDTSGEPQMHVEINEGEIFNHSTPEEETVLNTPAADITDQTKFFYSIGDVSVRNLDTTLEVFYSNLGADRVTVEPSDSTYLRVSGWITIAGFLSWTANDIPGLRKALGDAFMDALQPTLNQYA